MAKPCKHGVILPRGLKCDRGYLVIRLATAEGPFNKGFGTHNPAMEKAARLVLEDIRVKQKLGQFHVPSKLRRMRYQDAWPIYHKKWYVEYRDPKTNEPRSQGSISTEKSRLEGIGKFFNDWFIDAINYKALVDYRQKRMEFDGIANGTLNRQMASLSSLINCFKTWNLSGEVSPAVQLPKDETGQFINPCLFLPDLIETPRERIASLHEIRLLKESCFMLKDQGMWSIIGTELVSWLRKSDLEQYLIQESANGIVTLTQGKTGLSLSLPKLERPEWAKVWTNFTRRWNAVRQAAGCPDLQFRDLRKTGMRLADEMGFTEKEIAGLAGHANEATTKKHYLDRMKKQAGENSKVMNAMEEWLKKV